MKRYKKIMAIVMLTLLAAGVASQTQARVTEKVDAMIAENSPLKVNDTDLWLQIGYPLVFGLQYDKYATGNIVLGGGAGTYLGGFALDIAVKYLFLTGKFSPYLAGGPVLYYSAPSQNIFGLFGTMGLQYIFDSGMGLSIGVAYVTAITESEETFSYQWVNDSVSQASAQFGFHWNF
ncbi:hypothetical protein JW933_03875 [candidate division FCPU426 bacterium]|nr:hypothetical protein [candidate division FCPU426 bacterium]